MGAEKQMEQLAEHCVLFADIPQEKAAELLKTNAQEHSFAKGEEIYSPKHYQKSLGIIAKGKAVVEKENGVLLNQLSVGECFGAAALFVPQEQYVTIVRAKTACQVLFLSMESMQQMMMENPQIAFNYIRFLSGRIQFLNRKIDSFTASSAQETLLSYLRQQPQGISDGVPMAKLAELLNIGRTSLYRAVEDLQSQGKIKREGKRIELTDGSTSEE